MDILRTVIHKSQPNSLITLLFRETFIRRSWYSVLPDLDVTTNKTVVSMTQLIAALITIHRSVAFLADMYCFLDLSGGPVWLLVDD